MEYSIATVLVVLVLVLVLFSRFLLEMTARLVGFVDFQVVVAR